MTQMNMQMCNGMLHQFAKPRHAYIIIPRKADEICGAIPRKKSQFCEKMNETNFLNSDQIYPILKQNGASAFGGRYQDKIIMIEPRKSFRTCSHVL